MHEKDLKGESRQWQCKSKAISQLHAANYNSNLHHPIIHGSMTSCIIIPMHSMKHFAFCAANHPKSSILWKMQAPWRIHSLFFPDGAEKRAGEKQTKWKQLTHRRTFNHNNHCHFENVVLLSIGHRFVAIQSNGNFNS